MSDLRALINADAAELSSRLRGQQLRDFPPAAEKTMRRFSSAEASRFIGITEGYLRQIVADGKGPPAAPNGRRSYAIEDIDMLRRDLDGAGKGARRYLPHRRDGEELQIISVMNFKGGSGKTTTAAHLAQFLAFRAIGFLQSTSIRRRACRHSSAINPSWMSARTKRSTPPFAMMTIAGT